MSAKLTTSKIIRILTIISSALAAFAGGLSVLPIDSASLPLPPEWRPYLAGTALFAIGLRILIIPVVDSIIKALKDEEPSPPQI